MKKTLGTALIMCMTLCLYGQHAAIDSLLNLLKTAKEDTNRVNILYQLSEECDEEDIFKYANPALLLAKKLNYKKGISNASHNIGFMYYIRGNSKLALVYLQQSQTIRRALKDSVGLAESLYAIGQVYDDYSDYFKSLESYNESLIIYKKTGNKNRIAELINSIGFIYKSQGDIPKALDCFFKSLKIKEESGNKSGASISLRSIGVLYMLQGDFSHAEEYFQKSLKISNESGDNHGIAHALNSLGDFFQYHGNFTLALEYFQKSLKIQEKLEDRQLLAITLNNIGVNYRNLKNNKSALDYFQRGLKILEQIGDKSNIAATLNNIGNAYRQENELIQSEYYCRKSLELSITAGIPERIRNASESLSKVYSSSGKFKEAYEMHVLFKQMADSINNVETRKSSVKKQMQYEFETKEAEARAIHEKEQALSNAAIKRQKLIKNSTLGGVLIVGTFSFLLVRTSNRKRKTTFEKQVAEVETKALRSQMNPHFIFNSLNSIDDYILNNDIQNSSMYVNKFSKLMRLILESSRKEEVSLQEDLEALELYMQLENLRMKNKVQCTIDVSPEIDIENVLIPPMLLQPFIENSFKHAFQGIVTPKLEIKITMKDEMLQCMISDNGKGMQKTDAETNEKRKSLGMTVTRERLDIISKLKKNKAYFAFEELADSYKKNSGTTVKLFVPASFAF